MVGDQHGLPHTHAVADAACGVGQHHGRGTCGDRGAHGVHDAAKVVSLVGMRATLQ